MELNVLTRAAEIERSAGRALATSTYSQIRALRVEAKDEGVVIEGHVSSYYLKQLAQELLRELALSVGLRVVNRVEVARSYDGYESN